MLEGNRGRRRLKSRRIVHEALKNCLLSSSQRSSFDSIAGEPQRALKLLIRNTAKSAYNSRKVAVRALKPQSSTKKVVDVFRLVHQKPLGQNAVDTFLRLAISGHR
jgi:hypothetical protein